MRTLALPETVHPTVVLIEDVTPEDYDYEQGYEEEWTGGPVILYEDRANRRLQMKGARGGGRGRYCACNTVNVPPAGGRCPACSAAQDFVPDMFVLDLMTNMLRQLYPPQFITELVYPQRLVGLNAWLPAAPNGAASFFSVDRTPKGTP